MLKFFFNNILLIWDLSQKLKDPKIDLKSNELFEKLHSRRPIANQASK